MSNLPSKLFLPLDYFAKPPFSGDTFKLARARSVVGTNLFFALILVVGILFVVAADSLSAHRDLFIWGMMLPGVIANIAIAYTLRQTGWLKFCQQTTLIITFLAIVIGICSSGGPITASNNQLMILQAALALFLLGIRGGLIWSGIVLASQCLLYYLFIVGFEFPNVQREEAYTAGAIFNWALAFCAITSLILLIELNLGQLEVKRHLERERLRYMATHDGLTKLANRHLFEEQLKKAISNCKKTNSKVLLLYLDLDKFKPINDEWGHDIGDRVLQVIAARLKSATREHDTVARLGGDEFAVLLPDVGPQVQVNKLTESLHARITQPIHLQGHYFTVGCSIGICSYPENAADSEELWKQADAAMYIAKKKSARWHFHHKAKLDELEASV